MDVFLSVIVVIVALSCLATLMVIQFIDYKKKVINKQKLAELDKSPFE
ncbi:MAG: hypothetical protein GY779_01945 [Gammaproteobacteria bacterium]|nr:hypothetical protein [Gammaproteobacteria bacterium]